MANFRSCIEKLLNFHFPESSLETFLSKFFASLILKMHRFKIERKLSSPHPPHWILHARIFILMEKIVALRNPFSVDCRFKARKLMILSFLGVTQCLKITQNVAFEFFQFRHFPLIFVILKLTCLVTLCDHKLQVFKNSPKWTILGIFNELVNVARFARNVEWDIFCNFQTKCYSFPFCIDFLKVLNKKSVQKFAQHFFALCVHFVILSIRRTLSTLLPEQFMGSKQRIWHFPTTLNYQKSNI